MCYASDQHGWRMGNGVGAQFVDVALDLRRGWRLLLWLMVYERGESAEFEGASVGMVGLVKR